MSATDDVFFVGRENRWKKRGIAIIPTKFGISFTALFLNQVRTRTARVLISTSVLVIESTRGSAWSSLHSLAKGSGCIIL